MFNMQSAKLVTTPLAAHSRPPSTSCPQLDDDVDYMSKIPYSSAVGSMMYVMVCLHPDLAYLVSAISRYTTIFGKEHWMVVL